MALPPGKQIEVFYDGDCPLCMREIRMLMRKDKRERIQFTNIADAAFDPATYDRDLPTLMARIHGRLPDGTWIEGVEVFRQLYTAIGFGVLVAITRVPGISHLLRLAYHVFAKNRLKWTGRCAPDGSCAIPTRTREPALEPPPAPYAA